METRSEILAYCQNVFASKGEKCVFLSKFIKKNYITDGATRVICVMHFLSIIIEIGGCGMYLIGFETRIVL